MPEPIWSAELPDDILERYRERSDDEWRKLYLSEWPLPPPESPEEAFQRLRREERQAEYDRRWERCYGSFYGRH